MDDRDTRSGVASLFALAEDAREVCPPTRRRGWDGRGGNVNRDGIKAWRADFVVVNDDARELDWGVVVILKGLQGLCTDRHGKGSEVG